MAGFFKKRKVAHGPNKNEQKVMRGRRAEDEARQAGVLGARFPFLKNLRIHLVFLDANQRMIDEKRLALRSTDAAIFSVSCPGRCGQGTFDFSGKVAEAVDRRLPVSECGAKCGEPLYAGSAETCGLQIKCRLELDYLPAPSAPASA